MIAALLLSSAIALTFDDLPGVAYPLQDRCDPSAILRWNEKILATLKKHHAPATGFVNAGRGCIQKDVAALVQPWIRDGHQLGNHTAHHIDANAVSVADFERDVIAGEMPGYKFTWFRYPMLHTGETREKRDAIAAFLTKRGYRNGVVTMDSDEFLYNDKYATVYPEHAQLIAKAYLQFMESIVAFYEKRTNEVIGHPIPHILLLHASSLAADKLDDLLTMFERRGYRFITIDEAMRDPAYSLPDGYVGKQGISWIHRWGIAKGMPIVWEPDGKVP
jgi:peptidoglycan/xylan/chitin deacetylase (PgdA/CDA1 family)